MNNRSTDNLHPDILSAIQRALAEDIGSGDVTTNSIVSPDASMQGQIIAKQNEIVAGLEVTKAVYEIVDPKIEFNASISEGALVTNRQTVATISGSARSLLTAERTALIFWVASPALPR